MLDYSVWENFFFISLFCCFLFAYYHFLSMSQCLIFLFLSPRPLSSSLIVQALQSAGDERSRSISLEHSQREEVLRTEIVNVRETLTNTQAARDEALRRAALAEADLARLKDKAVKRVELNGNKFFG